MVFSVDNINDSNDISDMILVNYNQKSAHIVQDSRKLLSTQSERGNDSQKTKNSKENNYHSSIKINEEEEINNPPSVTLEWNSNLHRKVNPMIGWTNCIDIVEDKEIWRDPRSCCLCGICGDNDGGLPSTNIHSIQIKNVDKDFQEPSSKLGNSGRLLPFSNGSWVHSSCAIWSSEVWEDANTNMIKDMHKARSRGLKSKCFGCGRSGATIGCYRGNCYANYHFPCAIASGCIFTSKQQLYCSAHKDFAKDNVALRGNFEQMKVMKIAPENNNVWMSLPENENCYRAGSLVVHSLGRIEQYVDGFHSSKYITPPGYMATRIFWSFVKPKCRSLYLLQVLLSSNEKALFSITASDASYCPIKGKTIEAVYNELIKRVQKVNNRHFSSGCKYSIFPIERLTRNKVYGLNGPQVSLL